MSSINSTVEQESYTFDEIVGALDEYVEVPKKFKEIFDLMQGEVVEIVDFGSFIRLGPLDGLVHFSQICDDYISYEQVGNRFIGKETGKILEVNDTVRAKIIAVSLGTGRSGKLGLTMRQKFLGKSDWIETDIEEEYGDKTEASEADEENKGT